MTILTIARTGLLSACIAFAQPAVDPARLCSPPPDFTPLLTLDGNTNTLVSGRTDYPTLQEVKVLVERPNPFKFNYRTTYTAKVLESEAVAQFLKYLGLPPEPAPAAGGVSAALVPADPVECADAAAKFRADVIAPVRAKLAAAQRALAGKKAEIQRINDFISVISSDRLGNCHQAVTEADAIRRRLQSVAEVGELETLIAEAEGGLTGGGSSLPDRLDKWGNENKQCPGSKQALAAEIDKLKAQVEGTRKAVDGVKEALASTDSVKTRQALAGRLDAVLTADRPFHHWFTLPVPDEPTQFDIAGGKQEMFPTPGQMTAAAQVVKVTVGRPRFTLSGGIGVTSIGERNIIRQAGPPDGSKVFGYDKNSPLRPALVVLGTGHLYNFKTPDLTFGLSAGFLLGSQSGSANFEYVLGPSFGFLRNLLIVTPGVHIGKRQQIARFRIGDTVPASLADPLPTETNWRAGALISLTFRIR